MKKMMMMKKGGKAKKKSKFPGYDQANRIRGGLRKGGSAKKKKSSRKAVRGGGCEIR